MFPMLLKIGETVISSSKGILKNTSHYRSENIHESCYVHLINKHWFKFVAIIDYLQLCCEHLLGFKKWLEEQSIA